ncbi:MAG: inorganic phosphate transporter [Candidatus Dactylopiibacterium carminicum]|uniref:Phosphate transporter n=1 Tax=Candidatus Dactylopiibacterium carminicum TaxID=857335 RepID=A0A272ENS4_9RHOO|nr:inorganic phosphate transporter [Candidatus Dactylopiibacterium carminicum]KAF7598124.1 inorganic phosphate transporter [Candidatus Dactylopiibacterium carminicum]PAS91748.1 MAG: inorganic phosphate transporter [Candidatus Dactylopiibacterium carminicum]PAS96685.1 MAG: inorganic phosphate transporter [Candidatus Dactylopiibacterium carminicum]
MDLKNISHIEKASRKTSQDVLRLGLGLLFLLGIMLFAFSLEGSGTVLVISAVIGAYMAMNIGANDVANNVGPAVGSRTLTMFGALTIAAVFEAAGALIAGGEVVGTIRNGIIDPAGIADPDTFIWLMMAALLAGAVWLNIATAVGAPVSTTHSIVGAVLGAGIAAAGPGIANWSTMGTIVLSWVISPILGAIVAAACLFIIKRRITYQTDMAQAAGRVVPLLIALMTWTFATYVLLKGLNLIWNIDFLSANLYGGLLGLAAYFITRPYIHRRAAGIPNTKQSVNQFFTVPLIFSAALLSFAHGSNDVANAIGPLAAIVDTLAHHGGIASTASIPLWVMMIGALGISVGLCLFGPKLIRTVGSEITELDQMRAYCIAMAAALTVIVASQMGLPVSSTHIAVGGVFGVGLLREYLKKRYATMVAEIKDHHPEDDQDAIDAFLARFEAASIDDKGRMLKDLKVRAKQQMDPAHFSKMERKGLRKVYKQELVKRSQMKRIAAAWVITVPASAVLAALFFYMIRGIQG